MTAVLEIGIAPKFVDPDEPAFPPGITPESIAKGIEKSVADMRERGWTAKHCSIAPDETAESTIADCLAERAWDVVVIGGGVRLPPQSLDLFERVINAVRLGAPNAAIAFNTSPENTGDAAARWLKKSST